MILRKNICFKWLLSFWYNRCCSENIVAFIISLLHGDWCSETHWRKSVTKSEWLLASEKCTVPLKNEWLWVFFRNNHFTFKRTHLFRVFFGFFWNKHIAVENIAQTIDDCKISSQNKYNIFEEWVTATLSLTKADILL